MPETGAGPITATMLRACHTRTNVLARTDLLPEASLSHP